MGFMHSMYDWRYTVCIHHCFFICKPLVLIMIAQQYHTPLHTWIPHSESTDFFFPSEIEWLFSDILSHLFHSHILIIIEDYFISCSSLYSCCYNTFRAFSAVKILIASPFSISHPKLRNILERCWVSRCTHRFVMIWLCIAGSLSYPVYASSNGFQSLMCVWLLFSVLLLNVLHCVSAINNGKIFNRIQSLSISATLSANHNSALCMTLDSENGNQDLSTATDTQSYSTRCKEFAGTSGTTNIATLSIIFPCDP
jgi:hypothetical protein